MRWVDIRILLDRVGGSQCFVGWGDWMFLLSSWMGWVDVLTLAVVDLGLLRGGGAPNISRGRREYFKGALNLLI